MSSLPLSADLSSNNSRNQSLSEKSKPSSEPLSRPKFNVTPSILRQSSAAPPQQIPVLQLSLHLSNSPSVRINSPRTTAVEYVVEEEIEEDLPSLRRRGGVEFKPSVLCMSVNVLHVTG